MAWGVVGDFNCLLDPSEKKGGRPYAPVKFWPFVECVEDCELVDSPFTGEDYTWFNNRVGGVEIRSRIDRLLFNQPWMDMFSCLVHHLDRVGSDHAPLLVECKSHERPPARPFTFLNVWTEHEDFQRVVADSWREDIAEGPMFVFGAKLKRLAHSLKRWNRNTFGHIFDKLKALEQDVRDIELQLQTDPSDETYIEFKRRSALLKRQYRIEDEFWQQKAHAKWVTDGERNSGYFHSVVKDRRRKLYIHRIQDDRGVTSSALDMIPRLVTHDDNDRLCAVPEMEEVKIAVFAMDSRSAAGPDGFTGAFYKAAWTIICMDLLAMPRDAPHIHHLPYADDIVIFTSARGDTLGRVRAVLHSYEQISGQAVSFPKSAFYMHPKALVPMLERVRDTLGRCGTSVVRGWGVIFLRGKAIMIKSVLQAIPTHLLAAHFPPKTVIREMGSIMARFFWSGLGGTRRYHWGSWKTLAWLTREGGVGFLDFKTLAKSCSAKLWWNLRTQDTIWTTFMRAKYCSRVHPVSKQRIDDDSHTWKRMLDVRAVVEPMIRWRVLSGTSNFWWDTWSGLGALHRQVDGCSGYWTDGVGDMYRSDFMIDHDALPPDLIRQFCLEPPSLVSDHADTPVWTPSMDGKFTLASAKELLRPRRDDEVEDTVLKRCWQKHLPYKMSFLAWRVLTQRLPTDDVLARFGFALPSQFFCCSPPGRESIAHIFYHGSMARRVWTYFIESARIQGTHHSLRSTLSIWWAQEPKTRMLSFLFHRLPTIILWELWTHYAVCKYGDARPNFARIIFRVATAVSECIYRRWPSGGLLPPRWSVSMEHVRRGSGRRRVVPIRWVPPPIGTIKVNVARAPLRGAYAAIVRDSAGKFLYALSSIAFRWDPVERGGMDMIFRCIQWCISQSLLRIHVESHHSELACFFREGTPWYLHDVHARLRFLCSIATVQWFECDLRANGPACELALWAVDSTEGTREFTNLQDLDIRAGALRLADWAIGPGGFCWVWAALFGRWAGWMGAGHGLG
ncbi:unnamed protein product [Cuscuta campestris]|uniref:Reverse transcriptase zinc-binding domain-containing protein n=1 Tax=Cuscuta campestris TaxID=132261 RepID=A0A484N0U4_9ASTE|nr:unnamed protein product [Cuscuta campestris]